MCCELCSFIPHGAFLATPRHAEQKRGWIDEWKWDSFDSYIPVRSAVVEGGSTSSEVLVGGLLLCGGAGCPCPPTEDDETVIIFSTMGTANMLSINKC